MTDYGPFAGFGKPFNVDDYSVFSGLTASLDNQAKACVDISRVSDLRLMAMMAPPGVSAPLWAFAGPAERRALWSRAQILSGSLVPVAPPAPKGVTAEQLRAIMPNAGAQVDIYLDALNAAMVAHHITALEQQAAFLAQILVESDELKATAKNLNYRAQRIHEVWPKRFPNAKAAEPYAHNPEALANRTYADRNGNGNEASGDGYRYRGRGLMQVTGRANYKQAGFEDNPDDLSNPITAANTAALFWENNNLNAPSQKVLDRAHFNQITSVVNGGDKKSAERWAAYQRALVALGLVKNAK